jgi:hypothetical protein
MEGFPSLGVPSKLAQLITIIIDVTMSLYLFRSDQPCLFTINHHHTILLLWILHGSILLRFVSSSDLPVFLCI